MSARESQRGVVWLADGTNRYSCSSSTPLTVFSTRFTFLQRKRRLCSPSGLKCTTQCTGTCPVANERYLQHQGVRTAAGGALGERGRGGWGAAPELVCLVLAEAGGEVHGHAVLDTHREEGVVLAGQGAAAVRHSVGRELERLGITADDAERVDGAHDDGEVQHDGGDVVAQRAVDEGAELHVERVVHTLALQLLRRRPYARGCHLNLRKKLLRILERLAL